MTNQPHPSRQAVTWRLHRDLVNAVKAAAAERGETVLAFATRALTAELQRAGAVVPDPEETSRPGGDRG